LDPNILIYVLFSDNLSLLSSFKVREQASKLTKQQTKTLSVSNIKENVFLAQVSVKEHSCSTAVWGVK
jgi:hypothetical protein